LLDIHGNQKAQKKTFFCTIRKIIFFLKKYTPVKTQVAARIKKITVNKKFLDNHAAMEKIVHSLNNSHLQFYRK